MQQQGIERRRTIRLKRSALLKYGLEQIDKPSIKIAETVEEYSAAFGILYEAYHELGYVADNPAGLYCTIFHFLRQTQVFVFKQYLEAIATMSKVEDSQLFGLPMDSLFKEELDQLRAAGRRLVEFGSFAAPKQYRFSNAMLFLQRSAYHQSANAGATDICIMVNPKHVAYYKEILLFEDMGGVKTFGKFNAPAVGLRLPIDDYRGDLRKIYGDEDFDTNLHDFFFAREKELEFLNQTGINNTCCSRSLSQGLAAELLSQLPALTENLSPAQQAHLATMYPEVFGVRS